jgi:hypothetical protein
VGGQPLPEAAFRQFLKSQLPSHMVPAYLLHFEVFPITGNDGKLDRKTIKASAAERIGQKI